MASWRLLGGNSSGKNSASQSRETSSNSNSNPTRSSPRHSLQYGGADELLRAAVACNDIRMAIEASAALAARVAVSAAGIDSDDVSSAVLWQSAVSAAISAVRVALEKSKDTQVSKELSKHDTTTSFWSGKEKDREKERDKDKDQLSVGSNPSSPILNKSRSPHKSNSNLTLIVPSKTRHSAHDLNEEGAVAAFRLTPLAVSRRTTSMITVSPRDSESDSGSSVSLAATTKVIRTSAPHLNQIPAEQSAEDLEQADNSSSRSFTRNDPLKTAVRRRSQVTEHDPTIKSKLSRLQTFVRSATFHGLGNKTDVVVRLATVSGSSEESLPAVILTDAETALTSTASETAPVPAPLTAYGTGTLFTLEQQQQLMRRDSSSHSDMPSTASNTSLARTGSRSESVIHDQTAGSGDNVQPSAVPEAFNSLPAIPPHLGKGVVHGSKSMLRRLQRKRSVSDSDRVSPDRVLTSLKNSSDTNELTVTAVRSEACSTESSSERLPDQRRRRSSSIGELFLNEPTKIPQKRFSAADAVDGSPISFASMSRESSVNDLASPSSPTGFDPKWKVLSALVKSKNQKNVSQEDLNKYVDSMDHDFIENNESLVLEEGLGNFELPFNDIDMNCHSTGPTIVPDEYMHSLQEYCDFRVNGCTNPTLVKAAWEYNGLAHGFAAIKALHQSLKDNLLYYQIVHANKNAQVLFECCQEGLRCVQVLHELLFWLSFAATVFDFDHKTRGNGFRSLTDVTVACVNKLNEKLQQAEADRHSLTSRPYSDAHTKRITSYLELLQKLCELLVLAKQIASHSTCESLYPPGDTNYILEHVDGMNKDLFYGPRFGFQYPDRLRFVLKTIIVTMTAYSRGYNKFNGEFMQVAHTLLAQPKYFMQSEKRGELITQEMQKGDVMFLKNFWNLTETTLAKHFPKIISSQVGVNLVLPIPVESIVVPGQSGQAVELDGKTMFTHPTEFINTRLLSYKVHRGQISHPSHVFNHKHLQYTISKGTKDPAKGLLIHIHGGGFVAQSSKSHEIYLRDFAKGIGCPILSIDYSLAPDSPYPQAAEEVFYAYCWALAHASDLGTTADRVVVTGDSAGGNLALVVGLKCAQFNIRKPDAILAAYPALYVRYMPSPSRLLSVMDPLLSTSILKSCVAAYSRGCDCTDPLLSPGYAPDSMLVTLPPVHIYATALDPLLDDSIMFARRLKKLNHDVRLHIFHQLPHGFLSFGKLSDQQAALNMIQDQLWRLLVSAKAIRTPSSDV